MDNEGVRLNKFVANAGVCSRRKAADLVKAGKVKVNGKVVLEPYYLVQDFDEVVYNERVLRQETNKVYLLMNKPKNTITSISDEKGRKTVMDLLKNNIK